MKEDFNLEIQDPKRDELGEKEAAAQRSLGKLGTVIENTDVLPELEDAVYESQNQAIISEYNRLRFEHLKATNTFMDGDEEKINNLELETFTGVDDSGHMLDADGNPTKHRITDYDHRTSDLKFIEFVRENLIKGL